MSTKSNFEFLKYSEVDGIGFLTVNRPDKLNALNEKVLSELKTFFTEFKSTKSQVNGIVFTGEGDKAFIAGADIAALSNMTVDDGYKFGQLGQQVTLGFENISVPVIACVNGFALGGGCEMAMSCDFIYATHTAVFGQPEVKLGLIPGFGGTQRLAKLIGRNYAKEIIYTGRNVNAEEAFKLGLVIKIFNSKDEMIAAAKETIAMIAKNSPFAVGISKKVMNNGNDRTVGEGLHIELEQFSNIFSSYDLKEGTKAFVEKRKPLFKGE
ncbi:MAG: enoyl-CoA hydratase/isomerase family protein [Bacteriovoracaceae bacterium]